MQNNVNTRLVFDRKNEASRKKTALVQLEVRYEGKRKFISTGVKVFKGQFRNGQIVNREDADLLNEKIALLYRHVNEIANTAADHDQTFSFSMLDATSSDQSGMTFIDYVQKRYEERPNQPATKRQHRKVIRFLTEEWPHVKNFSDLTKHKILELDEYLHRRLLPDGRHMAQPTIYTYHKVLRVYINDAIARGLISESPYDHFRTNQGRSKPRAALTHDELHQFESFAPRSLFQEKIQDLFIVQCYTGLAYADLMTTDFTHLDKVGEDYVLTRETRLKTGTRFILAILPPVLSILKKYDFHLPHLAYDVYNRNLKALAIAAGLSKTVTTHIGRHTFATTVALASGIPIEVVSKMLGHTSVRTTQIYAKILPAQVLAGYNEIKKHLS